MTPLVSVLIPAYNAERWIGATLDSIRRQTWSALEVIVVDDGSSDSTAAVVGRCDDPRIRLTRQKNRGASAARNRAFAESRGELIQFLDADDLLDPAKIAAQVKVLQGSPRSLAMGPWTRFRDDPETARFVPEPAWRSCNPVEFLVDSAVDGAMFPPAAWLVPRSLCEAAGPWDERLSLNDDGEYFARVVAASDGLLFCPDALTYYRSGNPDSYGSQKSRRAAESALAAWDSIVGVMERFEPDARLRPAAATGYERIAAEFFGRYPDVVERAERSARSLGGGRYRLGDGVLLSTAQSLFGWKAALTLRRWKSAVIGALGPGSRS